LETEKERIASSKNCSFKWNK